MKIQTHDLGRFLFYINMLNGNFKKLNNSTETLRAGVGTGALSIGIYIIVLFELFNYIEKSQGYQRLSQIWRLCIFRLDFELSAARRRPVIQNKQNVAALEGWSGAAVLDRTALPPPPSHDPGGRYEFHISPNGR